MNRNFSWRKCLLFFCLASGLPASMAFADDPFQKAISHLSESHPLKELKKLSAAEYIRIRVHQKYDRTELEKLAQQLMSTQYHRRTEAQQKLLDKAFLPDKLPIETDRVSAELQWRWNQIRSKRQTTDQRLMWAALESIAASKPKKMFADIKYLLEKSEPGGLQNQIRSTLKAISRREDLEQLQQCLRSRHSIVVMTAADSLVQLFAADAISDLAPLLKTEAAELRFHFARILVDLEHRPALATLSELLNESDPHLVQRSWRVLAGVTEHSFGQLPYSDSAKRKKLIADCQKWIDENLATVELQLPISRAIFLESRLAGNTLITHGEKWLIEHDPRNKEVFRLQVDGVSAAVKTFDGDYVVYSYSKKYLKRIDKRGKVKWNISHVVNSIDWASAGSILVTTGGSKKVIEYDLETQKNIWEYKTPSWINDAARLPNGNTLITHRHGIIEVTPEKKIVWQHSRSKDGKAYLVAQPLLNGNYLIGTTGKGRIYEMTREKKVIWEMQADTAVQDIFQDVQGHTFVVTQKKIREYDRNRKVIWELDKSSEFGKVRR